ncbi:MAG: hypothetical protein R3F61_21165 [Myxococcota bacterium]
MLPFLLTACLHAPAIQAAYYPDPTLDPIAPTEAVTRALLVLHDSGEGAPELCAVRPIVAPVGGYLVDFRGPWEHEGRAFQHIRVGIPDGTEPGRTEPFALIAHGDGWLHGPPGQGAFVADHAFVGDVRAFARGRCGR